VRNRGEEVHCGVLPSDPVHACLTRAIMARIVECGGLDVSVGSILPGTSGPSCMAGVTDTAGQCTACSGMSMPVKHLHCSRAAHQCFAATPFLPHAGTQVCHPASQHQAR
jgi:hypothetical protein